METIYLAGPIKNCTDEETHGWREFVKAELADLYLFRDPMDRDYRGKERQHYTEIIDGDLADILASTKVLWYRWRPSEGSSMEMPYARMFGRPVHLVCAEEELSPWVLYHTVNRFATLEDAVLWFRDMAGGHTKREPHLALRRRATHTPQTP